MRAASSAPQYSCVLSSGLRGTAAAAEFSVLSNAGCSTQACSTSERQLWSLLIIPSNSSASEGAQSN